ncbi:N-formylglutamate amidohydrolase [Anaerovorax odorimutans]|uniref:N-formylglutamate amidohydrolase n=1 Tax=Anaerovorax odorimutans TaxID=109327 RepID=A0ABT1RR84_9FIRM|nr:N-formylglutamate amidohydrolase [Anaerovorax odorimutans]MCQ4637708.1 N-formylglutamate amidohydrolase [Anaerovorax odorimutans]
MMKNMIVHIPHASLYIPQEYKRAALISQKELEQENRFMCDYKIDQLLEDKSQSIIFPYSRLYCDVERFKDVVSEALRLRHLCR